VSVTASFFSTKGWSSGVEADRSANTRHHKRPKRKQSVIMVRVMCGVRVTQQSPAVKEKRPVFR